MNCSKIRSNVIDIAFFKNDIHIIDTQNTLSCLTTNKILCQNVKQIDTGHNVLVILTLNYKLYLSYDGQTVHFIDDNVKSFVSNNFIVYTTYDTALKMLKYRLTFADTNLTKLETILAPITVIPHGISHILRETYYNHAICVKTTTKKIHFISHDTLSGDTYVSIRLCTQVEIKSPGEFKSVYYDSTCVYLNACT